ncbi:MAG: FxsA family protein [bacterium]
MWLLLFIVVPAVELYLLIVIGARMGVLATIGLIIITGMIGWTLVRSQGISTLRRIQAETAEGRLPAEELVAGLCLLGAGFLLITPGFLTDTVGFLMLIPPLRRGVARRLLKRFRWKVMGDGGIPDAGAAAGGMGMGMGRENGEVIDIPPEDVKTYGPGS